MPDDPYGPLIPLDDEVLRLGEAVDARLRQEREARPTVKALPAPIELSFDLGGIAVTHWYGAVKIADQYSHVVSLGTLDDFPDPLFPDHPAALRLRFDDLTPSEARDLPGSVLATEGDIEQVLTFAGREGSTLIHCRAGISRSPAMALLLALSRGHAREAIREGLNRDRVTPNRHLLALGERVLGFPEGELLAFVQGILSEREPRSRPLAVYRPTDDGRYVRFDGRLPGR